MFLALEGNSFCTSAMRAFTLALKNSGSFFTAHGIGRIINSLGKASITVGNTAIGYLIITYTPKFREEIDQPVPFLVLIFLMSYKLASSFISVYQDCGLAIL